jgi:hypothetical protein
MQANTSGGSNTCVGSNAGYSGNLAGFGGLTGGYYVEEVNFSKSSEDFAKIKYKVVQRDGIA